jgi:hypothetical protein
MAYHFILIITISISHGLPTSACFTTVNHNFIIYFHFVLSVNTYYVHETPFSPSGIVPIYLVLSHCFDATSNMCVRTGNSKMKVEWTILTAPICKSWCGARNHKPRSTTKGAQRRTHSIRLVTVCLAVSLCGVTADWKLKCNEPQAVYVAYNVCGPWAVIPMVGT